MSQRELEVDTEKIIREHYGDLFGSPANEGEVANMVEHAYNILSQKNFPLGVEKEEMDQVTKNLKKGLEKFGVTDLSVIDSNKNNEIDEDDELKVVVKEWNYDDNKWQLIDAQYVMSLRQNHSDSSFINY